MPSTSTWQVLGLVLASTIFWMHYVDFKDRAVPEPRRRLLTAYLLGIGSATLAFLIFTLIENAGLPHVENGSNAWKAAFCFLFIGPVEEGVKVLLAFLVVFRWREFDELVDGFIYAAAISIGFASFENFFHLPNLPWWEQLARTATLPLTHSLFGAIWGLGIAHAILDRSNEVRRGLWIAGTIVLAMAVHGLYDFLLFAYQATLLTSGLILVLWLFVMFRITTLARREIARKVPDAVLVRVTHEPR